MINLDSKKWRLNNLYRIVDKNGDSIPFRLNPVQEAVFDGMHNRNLILKARQLGMSSFSVLYLLDEAIFNKNTSCGIVSYSLEHAQHIFKRIIGHALDTLAPVIKSSVEITQRSAREISFANGSYLRVDTTLRGGAYQVVLISEFGKTCARNPIKAEEVVTGTLQTIPIGGKVIIESTGEGNEGFYADMCNQAHIRGNENLSPMEYRLFFFPWFLDKNYTSNDRHITIVKVQEEYFDMLKEKHGIELSLEQKKWYTHQRSILGDKVKQEFPSTISEAFLSSNEAYYFQEHIEQAYNERRILKTNVYDALHPVYVSADIGINDMTVLVFFQVIHGEILVIDCYSDKNKGVDHYATHLLKDKPYIYHTIFLPHDAAHRDGIVVTNSYEKEMRKLFSHTDTKFIILKRSDKNISIGNAKQKFSRCVFSELKTKDLINHLNKYRKKWSEQFGKFLDSPLHDINSDFSDSFIYMCQAVNHIETVSNMKGSFAKHRQVVDNRRFRVI